MPSQPLIFGLRLGLEPAFIANLETGFAVKPLSSLTLRAFGGVNFDNRVPGISQQLLQWAAPTTRKHQLLERDQLLRGWRSNLAVLIWL